MGLDALQTIGGGEVTLDHRPFDIISRGTDNALINDIIFWPGTINQYLPTNMFDTFSYNITTIMYAYVRALTNGRAITSASIIVSATPPNPINTLASVGPPQLDILIGCFVMGTLYKTWEGGNMAANLSQSHTEDRPTPIPGLSPTIKYYTWLVSVV